MRRAVRMGLLVVLAFLVAGCGRQPEIHLTVLRRSVWRVSAQGQIAPFPYRFPKESEGSLQGSTAPLPSPDGQRIAFGDPGGDYDAHLLDVRTLRQHRITRLGKPYTFRSVSVDVLLDGWSPDSRRLLLYVTRGEDTSEEGELKVPMASYGFYEYDLASRMLIDVALPKDFEFVAWLRDERFVGIVPGRLLADDKPVILRLGQSRGTPIEALAGWSIRPQVSADGKWLVGLHADVISPLPGQGTAQIIKLDLATMAVTPLVTLSSWSGNERPALSPDDKHVAYKREMRIVNHVPQENLFVDGRQIYSCPGTIDFKWVGGRMIALACQDQVLVRDANTGHTLGRYSLPPAHPPR